MPQIKCPFSGCIHNSSNIAEVGGECQYSGTVEFTAGEYETEDMLDCTAFEARKLEDMIFRRVERASQMVSMSIR